MRLRLTITWDVFICGMENLKPAMNAFEKAMTKSDLPFIVKPAKLKKSADGTTKRTVF